MRTSDAALGPMKLDTSPRVSVPNNSCSSRSEPLSPADSCPPPCTPGTLATRYDAIAFSSSRVLLRICKRQVRSWTLHRTQISYLVYPSVQLGAVCEDEPVHEVNVRLDARPSSAPALIRTTTRVGAVWAEVLTVPAHAGHAWHLPVAPQLQALALWCL